MSKLSVYKICKTWIKWYYQLGTSTESATAANLRARKAVSRQRRVVYLELGSVLF